MPFRKHARKGPVSGPISLMDVDVLRSLLGTHAGDLDVEGILIGGTLDLGFFGKGRHFTVV